MANLSTPPLPSHPSARAASQARETAAFDDNDDGFGLEWRKYPMEELFSALQTSPRGLASAGLLVVCGGNALESKKQSKILAFLPLSAEAAVVAMVVGLARGGGQVAFGYALLALLAVDRSKRGRGPIMARTVAATMLIVLGSSGYSIAKIRRREGEFAQLTPTDQVLASRHLLEASLMGMLSSAPSLSSVGNLACLFWVNSHMG
jgi:hypothetical protein